jgi:cysteinyl-tRNA synthetase
MPILLHDARSNSLRELAEGEPSALVLGPSQGRPAALAELRHALISDVLARLQASADDEPSTQVSLAELGALLPGVCEPETLRYWILSVHYRAPLVLEESQDADGALWFPQLDECERSLSYLYAARRRMIELPSERVINVQTPPAAALTSLPENLRAALEEDLNTPLALVEAQEFALALNSLCDTALRKHGRVNVSAVESAEDGLAAVQQSLGLCAEAPAAFLQRVRNRRALRLKLDIASIDRRVAQRSTARAERDFATADRLQAELQAMGVSVLDGAERSSWTL